MTTSTDSHRAAMAGRLLMAALVAAGCSSSELAPPPAAWRLVSDGRPIMGTVLELSVASRNEAAAREWIELYAEHFAQAVNWH